MASITPTLTGSANEANEKEAFTPNHSSTQLADRGGTQQLQEKPEGAVVENGDDDVISSSSSEEETEYPTASALALITVALCLAVFLVALVSCGLSLA
jgi:hypothetical protein